MTRALRLLLLAAGLGIVAWLIRRAGVAQIAAMLVLVGWRFSIVAAIYGAYLATRAVALWRSAPPASVRYSDVLRIRLSGDAIELLTFTGPFFAEPTRGWLFTRRGLQTNAAFATVALEYLLYNVAAASLSAAAVVWLLARGALPPAIRATAVVVLVLMLAFLGACIFAAASGVGLFVPILRTSRLIVGRRRARAAVERVAPVEKLLVASLHARDRRLAAVLGIEAAAQTLLMLEIWVVLAALHVSASWRPPFIIEGGAKIVGLAFAFIPGQVGAAEGVYALLTSALGFSSTVGLTLALVRRARGLLVGIAGVVTLALLDLRHTRCKC